MKFNKFFISVLATSIVGTAFAYVSMCSPVQASCSHPDSAQQTSAIVQIAPRYYEYSEAALAEAQKSGKYVVLYFWAPWCSTCAALDNEISKDPETIPANMIVLQIKYDQETALKAKYHIVAQHTFVQIDKNGDILQLWVGGEPGDIKKKL